MFSVANKFIIASEIETNRRALSTPSGHSAFWFCISQNISDIFVWHGDTHILKIGLHRARGWQAHKSGATNANLCANRKFSEHLQWIWILCVRLFAPSIAAQNWSHVSHTFGAILMPNYYCFACQLPLARVIMRFWNFNRVLKAILDNKRSRIFRTSIASIRIYTRALS